MRTISEGVNVIDQRPGNRDGEFTRRSWLALWCAVALIQSIGCSAPREGAPQRAPQGRATIGVIRTQGSQGPWTLTLPNKQHLRIDHMIWTIADVEVHACLPPAPQASWTFGVQEAWAHVPDSATRLGTPVFENLLGASKKAHIIGEVAPPYGTYCKVWMIIAPADDDTFNNTDLDADQLLGASFLLKGAQRSTPDAPWLPITLRSTTPFAFNVDLSGTSGARFTVGPKESGFILIDKSRTSALFEGLDLNAPDAADRVVRALGATLTLYQQ